MARNCVSFRADHHFPSCPGSSYVFHSFFASVTQMLDYSREIDHDMAFSVTLSHHPVKYADWKVELTGVCMEV